MHNIAATMKNANEIKNRQEMAAHFRLNLDKKLTSNMFYE